MPIRLAGIDDLEAITHIYNEAILNTTATFDTEVKSVREQQPWFDRHTGKYPLLVYELERAVVGWAALSPWSDRCAYQDTAEISIYIDSKHHNQGIGSALMRELLDLGKERGLQNVLARIAEGSAASVHLHEKQGFLHVGTMKKVGFKFNRRLDVQLMQRTLS